MKLFNSVWDGTQSYLSVVLAYTSDIDWMTVGAFVLLVARLAQDVPKGVEALQGCQHTFRVGFELNR